MNSITFVLPIFNEEESIDSPTELYVKNVNYNWIDVNRALDKLKIIFPDRYELFIRKMNNYIN